MNAIAYVYIGISECQLCISVIYTNYYTSFIRGSGDGPLACSRILLAQIGTSIYNLFGNYSFTISFPIVLIIQRIMVT